jgi:DNA-binding IclR family transcriptional regulator
VLRAVVDATSPVTQKTIADRSGVALSTTHRLLDEMELQGWIVQDRENCRIEVAPAFIGMAVAISNRYAIEDAVRPVLQRLVTATGETVCLNLIDRASWRLVTWCVEESTRPLGYRLSEGETSYLHTGASGRAAMAYLSAAEVQQVITRHGLPKLTKSTITSRAKLRSVLAGVRRAGYAYSMGERMAEAVGVAAPVFGVDGVIRGSLLISIPRFRFVAAEKDVLARTAIAHAAELRELVNPLRNGS